MRRRPFHLVQDGLSSETVAALEQMLDEARSSELIGVAYVAMYRRREYTSGATGECRRSPTFSRGMVRALDDFLAAMITR